MRGSEIDEAELRHAFNEVEILKIDILKDKNEEFVANIEIKKSDFAEKMSPTEPLVR